LAEAGWKGERKGSKEKGDPKWVAFSKLWGKSILFSAKDKKAKKKEENQ
jgi:hypothetical protein